MPGPEPANAPAVQRARHPDLQALGEVRELPRGHGRAAERQEPGPLSGPRRELHPAQLPMGYTRTASAQSSRQQTDAFASASYPPVETKIQRLGETVWRQPADDFHDPVRQTLDLVLP